MWLMPDISHHQCRKRDDGTYIPKTVEEFQQAATVAASIMHKATQGNDFTSPVFEIHARRCQMIGLPYGAYHFVDTKEHGDGSAQAEHFWQVAGQMPGLTFLMIDWERAWRPLALDLAERLRELAGPDMVIGDYIGSHARSQGGQLPRMDFHVVPQYGPAELDPRYATDPLSAWQYTNGETNGTDWPSGVPGIGKCDMSAVYRPADFGLGEDVATLDLSQDIYPHPDKSQTLGNVLRELDEVLPAIKALTANVDMWDDNVIVALKEALVAELADWEPSNVSPDAVADAVLAKFAGKLSA